MAIHAEYSAARSCTLVRDDGEDWEGSLRLTGNPDEDFRVARRGGEAVAYARRITLSEHPILAEFGRRADAAADLAALLEGWSGPTLLIQIQERRRVAPGHARLAEDLTERGARVTVKQVEEEPGWHFVTNPAWEGSEVVRHTAEWLDALD